MSSGSTNAQQVQNLVQEADNLNMILGTPGGWTLSASQVVVAAQGGSPFFAASALSPSQAQQIQTAIHNSNAAATETPSAASGNPTSANTPAAKIQSAATGLPNVAAIVTDIQQIEAGGQATLHWWGWSLKLNQNATTALQDILKTNLPALISIATALVAVSAPLAAALAIVSAAAVGLNAWISTEDAGQKGVVMNGYLWVGVVVEAGH
jgi:hypothetical protein